MKAPLNTPSQSRAGITGRIFQIGFNRCGTMSLARFFQANGLRAAHWQGGALAAGIELARLEGRPLLHYVGGFDVYTDMELRDIARQRRKWLKKNLVRKLFAAVGDTAAMTPVYAYKYYKLLDVQYPGSRFILNTRDMESWIQSRLSFKENYRACLHGDDFHKSRDELTNCWEEDWHAHHREVLDYFSGRQDSLLVFDITSDPIERIVEFTGLSWLNGSHWKQHNAAGR